MNICKKYWLKREIKKYEKFLLKEGMREVLRRKQNVQVGLAGRIRVNDEVFGGVYLPQVDSGNIDVSELVGIGAKNFPKEARKYVVYSKMLDRLEKR